LKLFIDHMNNFRFYLHFLLQIPSTRLDLLPLEIKIYLKKKKNSRIFFFKKKLLFFNNVLNFSDVSKLVCQEIIDVANFATLINY
jgi:hypothetical protein